ncbi:hypothetical protein DFH06DRAFT_1028126 [Mycena polygramma]|nr:hypothetical protein DFH06DRAFT_1028126 [Mycena polygramma]
MASSKQVALARPTRPPVHAAQVQRVPAFLNKLYEMVNDAKTNNLIQWSALGDTFYVYDQERFAREVLPHWFKHQNFASFVRQLNMYGFHKIPHLQQGVLKSEADAEHWNFVHPNFRRDQPDLLCLIQRKKSGNVAEDDKLESTALPAANNAQVLDIQSIVNGIAAIKRHQTTISTELSELKRNNELLWQESQSARARHQKQQDTINRIVKFLAGVFGHHAGSPVHKEDVGGSPSSRAVVPRRGSRLMIEGADSGKVDEAESPAQFATIETPTSMASPIEPVSPKVTASALDSPAPSSSALPPDDSTSHIISTQPQYPQAPNMEGLSITPSRSPTNADFDTLIQGALSSLTPAQIQQLMNSISLPSMPEFPGGGTEQHDDQDSSLMSYQPLDFGQLSSFPLIPSPPQSAGLLEKTEKSWRDTDGIEQDVEAVDSKINNLFQQFQIPNDGAPELLDPSNSNSASVSDSSSTGNIENDLFHSFLNGLGDGDEDMLDEQTNASTAFLDDVPTPDGPLSPVNLMQERQPIAQPKTARKRKSDIPDTTIVNPDKGLSPGTRAKRRRER